MAADEYRTQIFRATLAQEARVFLGPKLYWRKVQLIIPEAPKVFIANDVDPNVLQAGVGVLKRADPARQSPDGLTLSQAGQAIGWDRSYKMPEFTSGPQVEFNLAPKQFLTGMSADGLAVLSVIVEWTAGPGVPSQ